MTPDIIGTCSRCGGPVYQRPHAPPRCQRCGGVKAERPDYGPIIDMAPPPWPEAWWMRNGIRQ